MIHQIISYLLLIFGFAAYFWFSQGEIQNLIERNSNLATEVSVAKQTIANQKEIIESQNSALQELTLTNQQINTEIDRYLAIFRRHDLNKLAEARPGLIESRINSATAQVFEEIESETSTRSGATSNPGL